MKWLKRTMVLALLVMSMTGTVKVQALNYAFDAWTDPRTKTIKLDLNKDGKKENIKMECYTYDDWDWDEADNYYNIYVNKKCVLRNGSQIWIMDIDTRDKYIEIVATFKGKNGLYIYRYNGKKLTLYASAKEKPLSNLMKKNTVCFTGYGDRKKIKPSGKGKIIIYNLMHMQNSVVAGDVWYETGLNYTVKKNLIKFDSSASCKVTDDNGKDKIMKLKKSWKAYKYPRSSSNKKIFTVNKGEKVKVTDLKFSTKYTYLKVKNLKSKKTGWVVFRTKEITNLEY